MSLFTGSRSSLSRSRKLHSSNKLNIWSIRNSFCLINTDNSNTPICRSKIIVFVDFNRTMFEYLSISDYANVFLLLLYAFHVLANNMLVFVYILLTYLCIFSYFYLLQMYNVIIFVILHVKFSRIVLIFVILSEKSICDQIYWLLLTLFSL